METLEEKLALMKSLAVEYKSSLDSFSFLSENYSVLMSHLNSEVEMRVDERLTFQTHVGLTLRQVLLDAYHSALDMVSQLLSKNQAVQAVLNQKYCALARTIATTEPTLRDIRELNIFLKERSIRRKEDIARANQFYRKLEGAYARSSSRSKSAMKKQFCVVEQELEQEREAFQKKDQQQKIEKLEGRIGEAMSELGNLSNICQLLQLNGGETKSQMLYCDEQIHERRDRLAPFYRPTELCCISEESFNGEASASR